MSIGQGATYLWIERINCGPGHDSFEIKKFILNGKVFIEVIINNIRASSSCVIGSLSDHLNEEGVQNVMRFVWKQ